MSQSAFIAAALLAGFVLWLAAKNRLGVYTGVLWGNTADPTPSGGASSGGGSNHLANAAKSAGDIAKTAATVAEFF